VGNKREKLKLRKDCEAISSSMQRVILMIPN
jgi:hypothetical protein